MSEQDHDQFVEVAIKQLSTMMDSMATVLNKTLEKHDTNAESITYIQKELISTSAGLAKVVKVLHEGNGERPVLTRLAILETSFVHRTVEIEAIINRLDSIESKMASISTAKINADKDEKTSRNAGKVVITAAIISGMFGTIAAIVQMFLR